MSERKIIESFGALPFKFDVRDYKIKKSALKSETFPNEFTLVLMIN